MALGGSQPLQAKMKSARSIFHTCSSRLCTEHCNPPIRFFPRTCQFRLMLSQGSSYRTAAILKGDRAKSIKMFNISILIIWLIADCTMERKTIEEFWWSHNVLQQRADAFAARLRIKNIHSNAVVAHVNFICELTRHKP